MCFGGVDDNVYCVELSDAGAWPVTAPVGVHPSGAALASLAVVPFGGGPRIAGTTSSTGNDPQNAAVFVLNVNQTAEERFYMPNPYANPNGFLTVGRDSSGQPVGFIAPINGAFALDFDGGTAVRINAATSAYSGVVSGSDGQFYLWAGTTRSTFVLPDYAVRVFWEDALAGIQPSRDDRL